MMCKHEASNDCYICRLESQLTEKDKLIKELRGAIKDGVKKLLNGSTVAAGMILSSALGEGDKE